MGKIAAMKAQKCGVERTETWGSRKGVAGLKTRWMADELEWMGEVFLT